jgi:hypothetical protein
MADDLGVFSQKKDELNKPTENIKPKPQEDS